MESSFLKDAELEYKICGKPKVDTANFKQLCIVVVVGAGHIKLFRNPESELVPSTSYRIPQSSLLHLG